MKMLKKEREAKMEEDRIKQGLPKQVENIKDNEEIVPNWRKILADLGPGASLQANSNQQSAKEKGADKTETGTSLLSSEVQVRFLEKWLNDVLVDCDHIKIQGTFECTESSSALKVYELDRIFLTSLGVPNTFVDRIYRGLYMQTCGFYQMLTELTEHLSNVTSGKKELIRTRIWKVYHILQEYACKSEYKQITTQIREQYEEKIAQLNMKIEIMNKDFIRKD